MIGRIPKLVMYYVYFLRLKNNQVYTGYTSDLKRRLKEHTSGKVASTKHLQPASLIGYEAYARRSYATRREKFLKTTEGKRLLRQQYRDVLNL